MNLRYDEALVEDAVFLCANRGRAGVSPLQTRRFHRERERLYSILDPDQRNAAFFQLHLEWFREWGLEASLLGLLNEFPLLSLAVNVLAFRKARSRNEEGAELYVSAETGRNGVVALLPQRVATNEQLSCFLRHELTHLHDMIDPAFGYSTDLGPAVHNAAQQRLTRERYRLLWDVTIDGRLTALRRSTQNTREQHFTAFERAFAFWPNTKRDDVFNSLWNNRQPLHEELLALAADPRDLKSAQEPGPGAPCPLCGFTTFTWTDTRNLSALATAAVQREFPHWIPAHGSCARCVAIYSLLQPSSLTIA